VPKFCLYSDDSRARIKANLFQFIDKLPKNKQYQVVIEPLVNERSLLQNKALFGVAYKELNEQSGNDKNDLHDFFCGEYFGWEEFHVMGMRKRKPVRTTTIDETGKRAPIDTKEFANFYAFIQQRSAQNGFYVSDPDPMWNRPE